MEKKAEEPKVEVKKEDISPAVQSEEEKKKAKKEFYLKKNQEIKDTLINDIKSVQNTLSQIEAESMHMPITLLALRDII